MNKEPKTLPQAIKIVVDKYGKDIVNNARMVNIMSDLIDLDESLATKKILKELLKLGYGKKIQETSTHDLVDLKLQFYINNR